MTPKTGEIWDAFDSRIIVVSVISSSVAVCDIENRHGSYTFYENDQFALKARARLHQAPGFIDEMTDTFTRMRIADATWFEIRMRMRRLYHGLEFPFLGERVSNIEIGYVDPCIMAFDVGPFRLVRNFNYPTTVDVLSASTREEDGDASW